MSDDLVEQYEHAGVTVSIFYDQSGCGDPRECDQLAHLYCWHPDYTLGDEQFTENDHSSKVEVYNFVKRERKATVILPLFLYDHSGITISAGARIDSITPEQVDPRGRNPFDAAGWDTSWVGFAYATEERRRVLGVKRSREEIERQIRVEVEEYDKYLRGEVYGIAISADGYGVVDDCWGFLGYTYTQEEAKRMAKSAAEDVAAKELNRLPVLTGA